LREAIFLAAEQARRTDPTLAARYHRLMVEAGKHHNSALCNVASTLLTRIVACWRSGQHYVIRDLDGIAVDVAQGRRIVQERLAPKRLFGARASPSATSSPTPLPHADPRGGSGLRGDHDREVGLALDDLAHSLP
jgi:hypothetical protein